MTLRFSCPKCGYNLSAPKECAGRSSKCRACGQPVTVPHPATRATLPPPPVRRYVPLEAPVPGEAPLLDALPAEPVLDALPAVSPVPEALPVPEVLPVGKVEVSPLT